MTEFLYHLFSFVCGQNPAHTWAPGGSLLPFCERCTGLYLGAAMATVMHLVLRPPSTRRFREAHGLFLALMVPFGFHWVPQGPWLRTVSGVLFAFGVVNFLCLTPARKLWGADPLRQSTWKRWLYWAALGLCIVLAPASGHWGGYPVGLAIQWIGFLGLFCLAILTVLNLGLGWGLGCAKARRAPGEAWNFPSADPVTWGERQ